MNGWPAVSGRRACALDGTQQHTNKTDNCINASDERTNERTFSTKRIDRFSSSSSSSSPMTLRAPATHAGAQEASSSQNLPTILSSFLMRCFALDNGFHVAASSTVPSRRIENGATENARLELSAPTCRGGKCGTKQLWKAKHLLVTAHTT